MVEKLNKTGKYFAIMYWEKPNKKSKTLLDYFSTSTEAEKEVARQKELDRHSETRYEYEILEKTGKQIIELW